MQFNSKEELTEYLKIGNKILSQKKYDGRVNYSLKAVDILFSDKASQVFEKGKKNNWNLNKILTELQIPKEQKQIILDKNITSREEIIISLLADNSFVVEINTTKESFGELNSTFIDEYGEEMIVSPRMKEVEGRNTQEYSDLTVPGGTNYTENEIATPEKIINLDDIRKSIQKNNPIKLTEVFNTSNIIKYRIIIDNVDEGFIQIDKYDDKTITVSVKSKKGYGKSVYLKIQELYPDHTIKSDYRSLSEDAIYMWESLVKKNLALKKGKDNYILNKNKLIKKKGIVPNIRGHAQFSTDNGIGWFRSDEQTNIVNDDNADLKAEVQGGKAEDYITYESTKTRRILELQSDLFQKGRDKGDLTTRDPSLDADLASENFDTVDEYQEYLKSANKNNNLANDNQFLQLLNKKGNWVTFFIESIVQDSAKKRYEKVLFPTGETAAKIEGHETIAEDIQNKVKALEEIKSYSKEEFENNYGKTLTKESQIKTLEEQLKNSKTQGLEKLKPIEAFYSNRVTNILNKLYDVKEAIDEHGNTWNEVTITSKMSAEALSDESNISFNISIPENTSKPQFLKDIEIAEGIRHVPEGKADLQLKQMSYDEAFKVVRALNKKEGYKKEGVKFSTMPWYGESKGAKENYRVVKADYYEDMDDIFIKSQLTPKDTKDIRASEAIEYDDLIAEVANPLIRIDKKTLERIDRALHKKRFELKLTGKKARQVELTSEINNLQEAGREVRHTLMELKDLKTINGLEKEYERYFDDVATILKKEHVTFDDVTHIKQIISLFSYAADTMDHETEHIFLDDNERATPHIRAKVLSWGENFKQFNKQVSDLETALLEMFIQDTTGRKLTAKDRETMFIDNASWSNNFRSLGHSNNLVARTIFQAVEAQNLKAHTVGSKIMKDLDKVYEEALPELRGLQKSINGKTVFDIFREKDNQGKITGNIISAYSSAYIDQEHELHNRLKGAYSSYLGGYSSAIALSLKKNYVEALKDYKKFMNDNMEMINPFMIADDGTTDPNLEAYVDTYTVSEKEEYKKKFIAEYGLPSWERSSTKASKYIGQYQTKRRSEFYRFSEGKDTLTEEQGHKFKNWIKSHSPYKAYTHKSEGHTHINMRYVTTKAKNLEGNYNPEFKRIGKLPKVKAFYDKMMDDLFEARKTSLAEIDYMSFNAIPNLKKSITEQFIEGGVAIGAKGLMENFQKALRDDNVSAVDSSERDPITQEKESSLKLKVLNNSDQQIIQKLAMEEFRAFKQREGVIPDINQKAGIRARIAEKVIAEKSWDLLKIVKLAALDSLSYKHKAVIHDQVKLAERFFKENKAASVNSKGDILKDPKGKVLKDKLFSQASEALEFYLKADYYGESKKEQEYSTKYKMRTSEEKKKIAEVEGFIANLDSEIQKKQLELESAADGADVEEIETALGSLARELDTFKTQLENLGGTINISNVGDMLLKYTTLKGLGWNMFSAFSNMSFGYLSNVVHAAGDEDFSLKELHKGYLMSSHSVLSTATFDLKKTEQAFKIRALVDKFGLMANVSYRETETTDKTVGGTFTKQLKRLGPLNAQERTEYMNIAPLMIASMYKQEVKNSENGEILSLWEAYDKEGILDPKYILEAQKGGQSGISDEIRFIQKVRRVAQTNHGDYTNPLLIKKKLVGRALSQYRTWMFEGFAYRFEAERFDDIRGRTVKGRYKSYTVGDGNAAVSMVRNLKEGFLGLLNNKTAEAANLSPVDMANMRKNAMELIFLAATTALTVLLKGLYADDDDEDIPMTAIFLINQLDRLSTDITLYTSPQVFQDLNANILPVFRTLKDFSKIIEAAGRYIEEDGNTTVQSGPYEGMDWFSRRVLEFLPGTSAGLKAYRNVSKVYNDSVFIRK